MRTLKQEILELPPKERDARRAFYSDEEWENSWELNAFPFQIEPVFDDWRVWTIIAPPKQGKTFAGEHWVWDKYSRLHANTLCIFRDRMSIEPSYEKFMKLSGGIGKSPRSTYLRTFTNPNTKGTLSFTSEATVLDGGVRGMDFHYVWADEIRDATSIVRELEPRARKFLFTQPLKLYKDTIVSRAGDSRVTI